MKSVVYESAALKDLRRHANVAARIRKTIVEYAAEPQAHVNNVTQLVGSVAKRMRIGDYRVVFFESDTQITVVKVAPRSEV